MTDPNQNADFRELIPELKKWNRGGKAIDLETWISCEADHEHLIGYARILWPDFVEHDGCIFWESRSMRLATGLGSHKLRETRKKVEVVMNHRHILDHFSRSHHEPPSPEVVLHVGRLMRDILQAELNRDFPGRKVTVTFGEDGVDDLADDQITFFLER